MVFILFIFQRKHFIHLVTVIDTKSPSQSKQFSLSLMYSEQWYWKWNEEFVVQELSPPQRYYIDATSVVFGFILEKQNKKERKSNTITNSIPWWIAFIFMNFILTLINTINKNFLLRSALFPFFTVFIWFSKIYNGLTLLLIKVDFFSIWVHVKLMFLFSNWTKHQVFWTTLLLNIDVSYYTLN